MRPLFRGLVLACTVLAGCARRAPAHNEPAIPARPPFAVVELFTSEGCSSCPPADRHLADIEAAAARAHENVFVLSYHVDYWDYLGWKDPFSDPRHSERQQSYARVVGNGQLYTPQMVVNGREAFVGSERSTASAAIQRALKDPAAVAITLHPSSNGGRLVVDYRVEGDTRDAVLNLSITQPVPGVAVARGENAGHTLSHRGVVRAFVTRELDGDTKGSASIDFPAGVARERATLVAYATDRRTLAVLGATATPLAR